MPAGPNEGLETANQLLLLQECKFGVGSFTKLRMPEKIRMRCILGFFRAVNRGSNPCRGACIWADRPQKAMKMRASGAIVVEVAGADRRCADSGEVDTVGELDAECIGCTDKCAPARVARDGAYFEQD